jgi:hypothetical protein
MTSVGLKQALAFGATYMALSMAIEILLIVVGRLRVPDDNATIAPILLIVSPLAAATICGYRRPAALLTIAVLTVVLTIAAVAVFGRLTGISTGVAAPIVLRTVAGSLAAALTARTISRA